MNRPRAGPGRWSFALTLITEAPKFAGLCEALREHRTSRYVPLVPLKPGDGLPPVFIIHGLGGNVAELIPDDPANDLPRSGYRYPGAWSGRQGVGRTLAVEAMAAEYLREVKARQPDGPYYLCGYSFGGLWLSKWRGGFGSLGDEVALVGLFDTTMSPLRWPLAFVALHCAPAIGAVRRSVIAAPIRTWPAAIRKMAAAPVRDCEAF